MKVAVFVTTFPSISQTFILNQVVWLIDQGVDVHIYAYRNDGNNKVHDLIFQYSLIDRLTYITAPQNKFEVLSKGAIALTKCFFSKPLYTLKCLNFIQYGRKAYSLKLLFLFSTFLEIDERYDVLHCHFGPNGERIACLKNMGLISAPIITTFHGYDINEVREESRSEVYKYLLRECNFFTVGSQFMKKQFESMSGLASNVTVLPCGVDTQKFELSRFKYFDRKNRPQKILTVARLSEGKGIKYGIQAFSRIADELPDVLYLIAGDGPLRKELESLVEQLNLRERVLLLGAKSQTEIAEIYSESSMFVLPSIVTEDGWVEAQGVVILEAQASSLPVIGSSVGGIPEFIEDGVTGFLVPQKDVSTLAEKIKYLLLNHSVAREMGEEGKRKVAKYSLEKLNKELLSVYYSVTDPDC